MNRLDYLHPLRGMWTGNNLLFLPDEPIHESASTASIAFVAQGKFCSIAYTWAFDQQPQDGLLLIGYDRGQHTAHATFIDSWHMDDKQMLLQGRIEEDGSIDVRGAFAVEGSADWGWRIVLAGGDNDVMLRMYNVSPEGEEFLGVEAIYTRTTT